MNYENTKEILQKDMEIRNYAVETKKKFAHALESLCNYSGKVNDVTLLDHSDVRNYLTYLNDERKLGPSSVNNYHTAIKQNDLMALNLEDVGNFLHNLHMILKLAPQTINIHRTAIKFLFITVLNKQWDENKDRYAILSDKCLHALRDYYRKYKPTNYLFEGQRYNLYISKESVQGAIRVAAIKCGINKKVTPHTLRHCFGTHLLENNTNLYYIKQLLGHSCVRTSSRYLETISFANMNVKSPLDTIGDQL